MPVIFGFLETPLTAFLVAAGAASVPILIHLLNRKRYRVVNWAAMRFLLAAQKKNTKRMRIEQLLLLLVRTAIVLLLVLAMASVLPWSESLWFHLFPDRAIMEAAGSRRTHKILVLDGSFSMGARVGEKTCFDRAREMVEKLLREAPTGDGFSVILMASPPRRVVPEPSEDAQRVVAEVQPLRLPHGNADLLGTLNAVEDLVRHSPGKFEEREVYFFTDLQRSTWTARQTGPAGELLQRIQGRARTIFVDVGADGVANVSVTNLALGVPLVNAGMETPISATLQNYGAPAGKQIRVQLLVGRARGSANEQPFQLRPVEEKRVELAPSNTVVNFSYRFNSAGDYAVQVRIDGDALELDDARSAVVTVKDQVPVLLVNGKPAAEPYDRATEWLADALNPYKGTQPPRTVAARPRVVSTAQFADRNLTDLAGFDCIYLCDVPRLDTAEVRRLENHLQRGGGLIVCLGPQVDLEAYNRILYRNGDGILPASLEAKIAATGKRFFTFLVDEKSYQQSPLDAFNDDKDRASLLAARFRQYIRMHPTPKGRSRTILSFHLEDPEAVSGAVPAALPQTGDASNPTVEPALVEGARYRGRVVLFGSTVNMDWTTWPISPSYPALMQEVLYYAVAGRLREQAIQVGDILEEYLEPGSALDAVLHLPGGANETLRTETSEEASVLRWTDTGVSGIYRAIIGQSPREHLFAVNVPAATDAQLASESDLARTNQTELQDTYRGSDFQLVTDLHQVRHAGGPGSGDVDRPLHGMGMVIARWMLLLMLVLLAVEVILAWRFGHYTAVPRMSDKPPAPGLLAPWSVGIVAFLFFVALSGVLLHAAWTGDLLGFLPEDVRGNLELRLGIPPPAPGEGTRWHLEFTPYFKDADADPWLAGAWTLLMFGLVVVLYLREGQTASRPYKLLLAGLRMFLVLLTLTVLLPQLRLWFERQGWPDVVLLLDDSRSMSTVDHYQDPAIQEAAAKLAQELQLTAPERLQLAQALLTGQKREYLEALLMRRRVKLHIYHCSSRAARVGDITEAHELEAAAKTIEGLRAEGDSTQLGTAVRQILNDFRGSSLTAVVLFTDGVTTEGEDLVKVSRYASQMGVPLFFVGIGDAHEVKDLRLHDLQVEDSVYVNDRLVFEGRVTAQGYTTPLRVPVRLLEKDRDGRVLELKREMVTTDAQGKPTKFRITYQPTEAGEKNYIIEVPEQEDEVKPADNNQLERTVFVRDAKIIKVLYVEGYPRYEYRFLKHLLERESQKEKGNKTIDLRVLLLDADSEYASEDKSALSDFPTKEELNQYDVILLGDVDPRDPKLGDKNLQYLADFVRERGGGLMMIAGQRYHSPFGFKDSPLRDVLPIQVVAQPADSDQVTRFKPELTTVGRFHPIFRFSSDESENTAIWNSLPELNWWCEGYKLQPAAEVLMVHPKRPALEPRRGFGDDRHPLLVQQFVGAGRCMFLGLDETWTWRLREKELHYNQFWIQTIRYLARNRLGRIELKLDRQTPYRRGEPIKVTVRFPDDAPAPAPSTRIEVVVTRTPLRRGVSGGAGALEIEKETLPLSKVEGSRATYEGLLTRTPEGEYRFWLSSPVVPDPKPRAECRVSPPPGEMEQLRMNQIDMERAAEETHGKFYTLATAEHLIEDLPAGTRVALSTPTPPWLIWNQAAMFALALGLLGSEWILRKRKHLL